MTIFPKTFNKSEKKSYNFKTKKHYELHFE